MDTTTATGVTIRLFVGCLISPDLRILLNQSPAWKQSRLVAGSHSEDPIEVRFQGKSYLGLFLPNLQPAITELRSAAQQVRTALQSYIPEVNTETARFYAFSQRFVK